MDVTDEEIREYKALHEKVFDEVISEDEAREIAGRVLTLYDLLARTLPGQRRAGQKPSTNSES